MKTQRIQTNLGEIAISQALSAHPQTEGPPLVFLHGIFLDQTLWLGCSQGLTQHRRIYFDMPGHGQSSDVGRTWHLAECVDLLFQVLDALNIESCIAIGHSWGGMTVLRAATQQPERFQAIGLFNMPLQPPTGMNRLGFQLQKILTRFPRFYGQQAAKSMYSAAYLQSQPDRSTQMQARLATRSSQEIAQVIEAVILAPENSSPLFLALGIPVLCVVGETDFVGRPSGLKTLTVPGCHISPHEAPSETEAAIRQLIQQVF